MYGRYSSVPLVPQLHCSMADNCKQATCHNVIGGYRLPICHVYEWCRRARKRPGDSITPSVLVVYGLRSLAQSVA